MRKALLLSKKKEFKKFEFFRRLRTKASIFYWSKNNGSYSDLDFSFSDQSFSDVENGLIFC